MRPTRIHRNTVIFGKKLNRGEYDAGQYRRISKTGADVWIQASYNPILDTDGKVLMVVKYATDITAQKLKMMEFEGHVNLLEETANSLSAAATQLTSTATHLATTANRTSGRIRCGFSRCG